MRWILVAAVAVSVMTACTDSTTSSSGISGDLIFVGGGQIIPTSSIPWSPAPPHLYPGSVIAYAEDGTQRGSVSFPDGQGFSLSLAPGTYRLVPTSGDAFCRPRNVTVIGGWYETVRLTCDRKLPSRTAD
jgi:hypothetical protein